MNMSLERGIAFPHGIYDIFGKEEKAESLIWVREKRWNLGNVVYRRKGIEEKGGVEFLSHQNSLKLLQSSYEFIKTL